MTPNPRLTAMLALLRLLASIPPSPAFVTHQEKRHASPR